MSDGPARLTVVGMAGGPPSARVKELLAEAALVVGGARHLAGLPIPASARTVVMGEVGKALDLVDAEREQGRPVVVLASGDPGFFGIVRALRERGHVPRVLPALSSVARAFGRAGLPWDDALVVSAHGRDLRRAVNACRAHPKVAVLTGPGAGPAELARELFPQYPRAFVVCEDLGGPNERVVRVRPAEATTRTWRDPNVVLVLGPGHVSRSPGWIAGARPGPAPWTLPDGGGLAPELRAVVLARLAPRVGDMVWSIGGGAVAVECARFGAAVAAIEGDEDACERVRQDVRDHHVKVAVGRGEGPAVLEHLPDPDAVFVGVGREGTGAARAMIPACAARALRCVVAVAPEGDGAGAIERELEDGGLTPRTVRLEVSADGRPAAALIVSAEREVVG